MFGSPLWLHGSRTGSSQESIHSHTLGLLRFRLLLWLLLYRFPFPAWVVPPLAVFLLDTGSQPLVASVISANAATTSLAIGCPPGEDSTECGYGPGLDLEHISGLIWQASVTALGASFSWSCQVAVTSAVCVTSVGGDEANDPGMATTTLSASDITSFPVTVTAGAESLSASGAGTAMMTGSGTSGASTGSKNMPDCFGSFCEGYFEYQSCEE